MMWRSWAHPRGLVGLARARARLGDLAGARAALDRLLREWAQADPTAPLLAEARGLLAELEVDPGHAGCAPPGAT